MELCVLCFDAGTVRAADIRIGEKWECEFHARLEAFRLWAPLSWKFYNEETRRVFAGFSGLVDSGPGSVTPLYSPHVGRRRKRGA